MVAHDTGAHAFQTSYKQLSLRHLAGQPNTSNSMLWGKPVRQNSASRLQQQPELRQLYERLQQYVLNENGNPRENQLLWAAQRITSDVIHVVPGAVLAGHMPFHPDEDRMQTVWFDSVRIKVSAKRPRSDGRPQNENVEFGQLRLLFTAELSADPAKPRQRVKFAFVRWYECLSGQRNLLARAGCLWW